PLGLVSHDLQEPGSPMLQRHHQPAAPESTAILAHMPTFVLGASRLECDSDLPFRFALRKILGCEDDPAVASDDLVFAIAEQAFCTTVPACHEAGIIDGENRIIGGTFED